MDENNMEQKKEQATIQLSLDKKKVNEINETRKIKPKVQKKKKANMYEHCVSRLNILIGCKFDCVYCRDSYQAQMKRQGPRCKKCYNYEVHLHEDRLVNLKYLPRTLKEFEFIWLNASSDISNIEISMMKKILWLIEYYSDRTFFIQTKDPSFYVMLEQNEKIIFPDNLILGITLETNRDDLYIQDPQKLGYISKAPLPSQRYKAFQQVKHLRKCITIEPVIDFHFNTFLAWIRVLKPERIYFGFETKKRCYLREPSLKKALAFYKHLCVLPGLKVFAKYIPFKYKLYDFQYSKK